MSYELNVPWQAVENRVAKVGVGAILSAEDTTDVTTTYARLEGTFTNIELEGFELDVSTSKLKYNPSDGVARTFKLSYSGEMTCPSVNDIGSIAIELTRAAVSEIINGSESNVTCRTANSPYSFSRVLPVTLEVGDLIEIQVKGDASFTLTMKAFTTTLTKFY